MCSDNNEEDWVVANAGEYIDINALMYIALHKTFFFLKTDIVSVNVSKKLLFMKIQ